MKLAVLIPFYQEEDTLPHLLENLLEHKIELVICVDGKHSLFPTTNRTPETFSTDKSHEIIQSFKIEPCE